MAAQSEAYYQHKPESGIGIGCKNKWKILMQAFQWWRCWGTQILLFPPHYPFTTEENGDRQCCTGSLYQRGTAHGPCQFTGYWKFALNTGMKKTRRETNFSISRLHSDLEFPGFSTQKHQCTWPIEQTILVLLANTHLALLPVSLQHVLWTLVSSVAHFHPHHDRSPHACLKE